MAEVKVKVDSGVVNTRKSKEYAQKSEAWAVGKVDGVDVPNTADQYHNNSKYYKEIAMSAAATATNMEYNAEQDALKSEGYAVGKQNGTDVSSGTYYHNNSKYFAIEAYNHSADADNAKIDAVNAKNAAASSKLDSEAYAVGKRNGSDVTSGDPAYHNNSKYYSGEASSSATSASSSASTATSKAQDSEAYAVGKRGGTDVTSGDPAYHNNSKYYSTQAASSATAASGSATSAASSATAAAASASAIADTYDSTKTYAVGEYCLYNGGMYVCTTAITTAEAWTAAHWSAVKVGTELTALKEDLNINAEILGGYSQLAIAFESGSISNTGEDEASTAIRTHDFLDLDVYGEIICNIATGYNGIVYYYKSDGTYITRGYAADQVVKGEKRYGDKIRIVVYRTDSTKPFPVYSTPSKYITISANRLNNFFDVSNGEKLQNGVQSIQEFLGLDGYIYPQFEQGWIDGTGADVPSPTYIRTKGYVDLSDLISMTIEKASGYCVVCMYYDKDYAYSGITYDGSPVDLSKGKYLRFVIWANSPYSPPDYRVPNKYINIYVERQTVLTDSNEAWEV